MYRTDGIVNQGGLAGAIALGGDRVQTILEEMQEAVITLEGMRGENLRPDGSRRRNPSSFKSYYVSLPNRSGISTHALSDCRAFMSSSVVTDGGSLVATYSAFKASALEQYPDIAVGHGRNPYGEFVLYAKYVYPESRVAPLGKPAVINSRNGVSLMFSITGSAAHDPTGMVVIYKGLRRCSTCGLVPNSYQAGSLRCCKGCSDKGGMVPWYCNEACQHADWQHHKAACKTPLDNAVLQKQLLPF
jgi:hypothetical protein